MGRLDVILLALVQASRGRGHPRRVDLVRHCNDDGATSGPVRGGLREEGVRPCIVGHYIHEDSG